MFIADSNLSVRHALSNPNDKDLQSPCEHHHTQKCDYCDQLNETIRVFTALVNEHGPKLGDSLSMDIMLEDTESAVKDIVQYQAHLIKTFISNKIC